MKITDMKVITAGNPWKNWGFVKLETDEGICGYGECGANFGQDAGARELISRVIGLDPMNVQYVRQFLWQTLFQNISKGANAVEEACWDIIGKKLGVPLYQLLGGKVRPRIRCYANGWYNGGRDPKAFAAAARRMVDMGYTALKFDPFGTAYKYMTKDEERYTMKLIAEVRKEVGPDVDLMIEAHDRFHLSQAIRIGHMIEEFDPFWYETPVMSDNIDMTAEVARRVNVRVIAGERTSDARALRPLLQTGAFDVVNPDFMDCGITGMLDCYSLARAYDAYLAPHSAQSPFCTAVNAHLDVSQANCIIQENFDDSSVDWTDDVLQGYPKVKDGYIEASDKPGIGVEINEEEAMKHPCGDKNYLWIFQDGWESRKGGK